MRANEPKGVTRDRRALLTLSARMLAMLIVAALHAVAQLSPPPVFSAAPGPDEWYVPPTISVADPELRVGIESILSDWCRAHRTLPDVSVSYRPWSPDLAIRQGTSSYGLSSGLDGVLHVDLFPGASGSTFVGWSAAGGTRVRELVWLAAPPAYIRDLCPPSFLDEFWVRANVAAGSLLVFDALGQRLVRFLDLNGDGFFETRDPSFSASTVRHPKVWTLDHFRTGSTPWPLYMVPKGPEISGLRHGLLVAPDALGIPELQAWDLEPGPRELTTLHPVRPGQDRLRVFGAPGSPYKLEYQAEDATWVAASNSGVVPASGETVVTVTTALPSGARCRLSGGASASVGDFSVGGVPGPAILAWPTPHVGDGAACTLEVASCPLGTTVWTREGGQAPSQRVFRVRGPHVLEVECPTLSPGSPARCLEVWLQWADGTRSFPRRIWLLAPL